MAVSPSDDDGRIPFRIRIGVTGHRTLPEGGALGEVVRQQVRRIFDLFHPEHTTVRAAVVTQLAEGADRLVVHEVMAEVAAHGETARLECFLPMRRDEYVEAQGFDASSLEEFNRLASMAHVLHEPAAALRADNSHGDAYGAAGHLVVGRSDVLIALWDGLPSRGKGGTAETLVYAAARSKPCIWIETEGDHTVRDNLTPATTRHFFLDVSRKAALASPIEWVPMDHPERTTAPLEVALESLDEFNGEKVTGDFPGLLARETASWQGVASWVAGPFVRASTLAARWQRRFQWTARLVTLLAALGAVMLGFGLSYGKETEGWAWAEAAMFTLALVGLATVRRMGFHRRWLSYRVLAERLRSAHFLAPTGADFRRQARLEAVYSGSEPTGWLMRAFEEVWDRRPLHPPPPSTFRPEDLQRFKEWLAEEWIGGQIAYHEAAVRHHRRWHEILASSVGFFFVATIIFAVFHSLHVMENAAVLFSIVLPAAGASIGVLLTVNQHHALSERSARMRSDLAIVRRDILDAPADALDTVSSEAARAIAQENGAWFGSMWFLDIEHP